MDTGVRASVDTTVGVKSACALGRGVSAIEIAVLDEHGVITWVNDAWRDSGHPRRPQVAQADLGASFLEICDGSDDPSWQRMAGAVRTALRGAATIPVELEVPRDESGISRSLTAVVGSRLDDHKRCVGATVTMTLGPDQEPRAGEPEVPGALELTRETLLALTEASPEGLVVVDAAGKIVHVNARLELMSGHPAADLVGRTLATLVPERLRTKHAQLHKAYRLDPRPRLMGEGEIMPLLRADGDEVPVQIALHPGRINERDVVLATVRDLTERSIIEARLRDSETSFRAVFEEAPIPAAILTLDDGPPTVQRANPAFATLFGDESTETALHALDPIDDNFTQLVDDLKRDPELRRSATSGFRRADGSTRWTEIAASVVTLPDLTSPAMLAFFLDVTERRAQQSERERKSATKDAVARITTAVLTGAGRARVHAMVLDAVLTVLQAESACLGFVNPGTPGFREVSKAGPPGKSSAVITPALGALLAVRTVPGDGPTRGLDSRAEWTSRIGDRDIAARFDIGGAAEVGVIVCSRAPAAPPFTEAEEHDLGSLARQLAMALHLGEARADQERLALIDERQRISVDLHDTVIQDLIGIGLQLQFGEPSTDDSAALEQREALLNQLDRAVRRLRGIVFELHQRGVGQSLTQSARTIAADAARALGFEPTLSFRGPVDAIPALVAEQIVAVLREALGNVARHADADSASVHLIAKPDAVILLVDDDGQGMPPTGGGGHGLTNMRQRARDLGGDCIVTSRIPAGTRIQWWVPMPDRR